MSLNLFVSVSILYLCLRFNQIILTGRKLCLVLDIDYYVGQPQPQPKLTDVKWTSASVILSPAFIISLLKSPPYSHPSPNEFNVNVYILGID